MDATRIGLEAHTGNSADILRTRVAQTLADRVFDLQALRAPAEVSANASSQSQTDALIRSLPTIGFTAQQRESPTAAVAAAVAAAMADKADTDASASPRSSQSSQADAPVNPAPTNVHVFDSNLPAAFIPLPPIEFTLQDSPSTASMPSKPSSLNELLRAAGALQNEAGELPGSDEQPPKTVTASISPEIVNPQILSDVPGYLGSPSTIQTSVAREPIPPPANMTGGSGHQHAETEEQKQPVVNPTQAQEPEPNTLIFSQLIQQLNSVSDHQSATPQATSPKSQSPKLQAKSPKSQSLKGQPIPAKPKTVKAQPVKPKTVKIQPVKAQPVKPKTVKIQPVKAQPVKPQTRLSVAKAQPSAASSVQDSSVSAASASSKDVESQAPQALSSSLSIDLTDLKEFIKDEMSDLKKELRRDQTQLHEEMMTRLSQHLKTQQAELEELKRAVMVHVTRSFAEMNKLQSAVNLLPGTISALMPELQSLGDNVKKAKSAIHAVNKTVSDTIRPLDAHIKKSNADMRALIQKQWQKNGAAHTTIHDAFAQTVSKELQTTQANLHEVSSLIATSVGRLADTLQEQAARDAEEDLNEQIEEDERAQEQEELDSFLDEEIGRITRAENPPAGIHHDQPSHHTHAYAYPAGEHFSVATPAAQPHIYHGQQYPAPSTHVSRVQSRVPTQVDSREASRNHLHAALRAHDVHGAITAMMDLSDSDLSLIAPDMLVFLSHELQPHNQDWILAAMSFIFELPSLPAPGGWLGELKANIDRAGQSMQLLPGFNNIKENIFSLLMQSYA